MRLEACLQAGRFLKNFLLSATGLTMAQRGKKGKKAQACVCSPHKAFLAREIAQLPWDLPGRS